MKVQPLDDRVLVKPSKAEERSVGGIILPDTVKEAPQEGTVIAVGTDEELKNLVSEGDQVLFSKFGGSEVKIDGDTYVILSRSDILGKVIA
ncbi:co-chaperone GroES [Alicyclobacillaceae bacterium I2511]|nr:co-chaperone GroES [Alicyclobacillaceae bacterium I2511]